MAGEHVSGSHVHPACVADDVDGAIREDDEGPLALRPAPPEPHGSLLRGSRGREVCWGRELCALEGPSNDADWSAGIGE